MAEGGPSGGGLLLPVGLLGEELHVVGGVGLAIGADGEEFVGEGAGLVGVGSGVVGEFVAELVAPGVIEDGAGLEVGAGPLVAHALVFEAGLLGEGVEAAFLFGGVVAEVEAVGVEGGGDVLEKEGGGVLLGALLLGDDEDDEGTREEEDDDDDEEDLDQGEALGGTLGAGPAERLLQIHTR